MPLGGQFQAIEHHLRRRIATHGVDRQERRAG